MKTAREKIDRYRPFQQKIADYIRQEGSGPTVGEFMKMTGMKSKGHAHGILLEMEGMGMISRTPHKARSIRTRQPE
jgi:SOS-response transcriptional repressor LexA